MKKGALLLLFVLVLFGLYSLWANWGDKETAAGELVSVSGQSGKTAEADRDKDGLKDWEEALWGSNPERADSDRDGTLDGQEVAAGRNPAVAGPEDTFVKRTSEEPSNGLYSYSYDPSLGETLTDRVSRNLASNYLEAKSANQFEAGTAEEIARRTVLEVGSVNIYRDIKLAELHLVSNDTSEIESYGEKVIALLMVISSNRFAEAGIASTVVQGGGGATKLGPYIEKYADLRDLMTQMSVPKRFSSVHLKVTQDLDTITRSLATLAKAEGDPLAATLELVRYSMAVEEFGKAYEDGVRLASQKF